MPRRAFLGNRSIANRDLGKDLFGRLKTTLFNPRNRTAIDMEQFFAEVGVSIR